jgi:hypothetical protein
MARTRFYAEIDEPSPKDCVQLGLWGVRRLSGWRLRRRRTFNMPRHR